MEEGKNRNKNPLFSANLSTEYPQRAAIVGGGKGISYELLHRNIAFLSKQLKEMGVRKGSRVALWGYNSANWLISFFSIIRAGGTAVLLNYSMSCQDAGELLTMTETGFLLCGNNSEMKTDPDAMRRLGDLAGIPSERCLDIRDGVLSFDPALMEGTKEFDALEARTPSEAGETAFIIFTSGTTSKPKAMQISQKALTFDADAFKEKPRF